MTQLRSIAPNFSIAAQIDPQELRALAAAGFRSIISNRPDNEEPRQPDWAEIAAAAAAAGMEARHIPVRPGAIADADVTRFSAALEGMPGPILAFCRSGTRAASLWGLSQMGKLRADEIIGAAAAAGCDLSSLQERIERGGGAKK